MNVINKRKKTKKHTTSIENNAIEIIDIDGQNTQNPKKSDNILIDENETENKLNNNIEEVPNNINIYNNKDYYLYVTHEKDFKPFPLWLSIIVLIVNIFLPGFGTFISICGVNSCNIRCKLIFRACIQFITIPFFLTGWFLALSQSILFIQSRNYNSFEEFLSKMRNNEVLLFIGKEDECCLTCTKKCSNQCDCCNYCCGECCKNFCKYFSKIIDFIRKIVFCFTYNFSHCVPCYSWYVCVFNSRLVYLACYITIGCLTIITETCCKKKEEKGKEKKKEEPKIQLEYEAPESFTLKYREHYLIDIGKMYGEKDIIYEQKGLG